MTVTAIVKQLEALANPSYRKILINHGAEEPVLGVEIAELKKLQKKRMTQLNEWRPRAGREWLVRARCTRLVRVAAGQPFNLQVTPQLAKDIASVASHLDMKKVG